MATGYTAGVGDGTISDFPSFALSCARAFGALVTMRDDPSDAPIPEQIEPSHWHVERLQEARDRLAALKAMTASEIEVAARDARDIAQSEHGKNIAKSQKTIERYGAMLGYARAWKAPTPEHEGLRTFMIEQLVGSIDFDAPGSLAEFDPTPFKPFTWHEAEVKKANWNIEYHTRENAKEIQRAAERTQWLIDLRKSLSFTEAA